MATSKIKVLNSDTSVTNLATYQNSEDGMLKDIQRVALCDPNGNNVVSFDQTNTSVINATGASGIAVTATITAPTTGLFVLIDKIEITAYNTTARTGTATPVNVTTTNLGGLVSVFQSFGAIGTSEQKILGSNINLLRSAVSATAVTVICPATTGVIWNVNIIYKLG